MNEGDGSGHHRTDFYIEPNCCLRCGVLEAEAPEFFRMDDHGCHVVRDPLSAAETNTMVSAMWLSEVDCVRYRGTDQQLLQRLGEAGLASLADDERAARFVYKLRDHVFFRAPHLPTAADAAHSFRQHLSAEPRRLVRKAEHENVVTFAWYKHNFHSVAFVADDGLLAILAPNMSAAILGLAQTVQEWLETDLQITAIAWCTAQEARARAPGIPTPF